MRLKKAGIPRTLLYMAHFVIRNTGLAHCLSADKKTVKHASNELEYAYNILFDTLLDYI